MARIIPDYNVTTRKTVPSWIDTKAIVEAGKGDLKKISSLTKQASQSGKIVASYFCAPCNKVFQASHSDFIKQATLARKSNKKCELLCPKCGHKVTPYKEIVEVKKVSNLQTLNTEKRVDLLDKTASSKGTYNTFVDRKIMYEAIEKLARYASKAGMTACVARYVKGEHIKEAGSDLSTINNIECTLEWMFGRKQKGRATAKIKVDAAGKFEFPRVFKVASGMEYPFEEKYIRRLEREPAMFQSMPTRKKSDVPVYRKPDPTRFRVVGSMKVGEYRKKNEK